MIAEYTRHQATAMEEGKYVWALQTHDNLTPPLHELANRY